MLKLDILAALPPSLKRVAHDITQIVQDSIRLTTHTVDESHLPMGASKIGGLPDLPSNVAWPVWQSLPMSFIAQVQLAEVRVADHTHTLPTDGILWFFYDAQQQTFGADPNDRGGWQVLYAPGNTHLQRATAPTTLPSASIFKACAVTVTREATLPQQPALFLPHFDWTSDEQAAYEAFLATFPSPADHASVHHRILGHPDQLQDDMRLQCALASHGIRDINDPRADALKQTVSNWLLLLQIDSDEQAGMRWADNGMLYYWIEQEPLHNRNFADVWLVLQSE